MGNIVDYLKKYGKYSLLERPFSDEDSLAIAQLSYLKFEGAVSGILEEAESVCISQIRGLSDDTVLFADILFAEENRALYDAICESRRFRNMKINFYVNRIDLEKPSQFSAVTFFLEDGLVYVAFRGTDETLIGWREDFDMACRMPIKSQELSVEYLNLAASKCKGTLIVGGHSKGGNLAVYAAMYCAEEVRTRIKWVYNLDGPGFLQGCRCQRDYEKIAARVRKIIPQASIVGMLFEDSKAYEVVESSSRGVLQHDAFSWIIEEGHFLTAEDVYKSWKTVGEIVNRWLASLTEKELLEFTEEIFGLFDVAQAETLMDFSGNWKRMLLQMAEAFRDTDKETKRAMWKVGKALFKAAGQVAQEHVEKD